MRKKKGLLQFQQAAEVGNFGHVVMELKIEQRGYGICLYKLGKLLKPGIC